ncbi:hypothetical protein [Sinomicrobium oceani]|uniref:hypothetical protein n=1 Tax=Sinomicrobium oceani TaxID=1150368 RepID=UPI001587640A|nr:hypothetical protein [Sinomicrobium oceani]
MDAAAVTKGIHAKAHEKGQKQEKCPVLIFQRVQQDKQNVDVRVDVSQKLYVITDENLYQDEDNKPYTV